MADNDLEFTAEADPRVTTALRARFAAPSDEAYWSGLQSRVMARIGSNARVSWLQIAAGWARPGLAAAAVILVVAAALLGSSRADTDPVTFATVADAEPAQPEFIYTEHDATSQRDETLRLVVSLGSER